MTFIQIIEYQTSRADELDAAFDEWLSGSEGKRTVVRDLHTRDLEKPGHYVDIVEFPSYEAAMKNNDLPETKRAAERVRSLCDGEPRFVNLEVAREEPART